MQLFTGIDQIIAIAIDVGIINEFAAVRYVVQVAILAGQVSGDVAIIRQIVVVAVLRSTQCQVALRVPGAGI